MIGNIFICKLWLNVIAPLRKSLSVCATIFVSALANGSMFGKHSIASVDISMKSNTFALQNIKQRIWQAVKILKGYWNFTTRSQRQVEYQLFLSVKRMVLSV